MKKLFFISLILITGLIACNKEEDIVVPEPPPKPFVCGDEIQDKDGNYYLTAKIGNQCWMAENLNLGVQISVNKSASPNGIIEKYCYNDDPNNCLIYGALYTWNELIAYSYQEKGQGICPDGWRIPVIDDFETLTQNAGVPSALVEGGESGFDAWFGGFGDVESFQYFNINSKGHYATSTTDNNHFASFIIEDNNMGLYVTPKKRSVSIRCIKTN